MVLIENHCHDHNIINRRYSTDCHTFRKKLLRISKIFYFRIGLEPESKQTQHATKNTKTDHSTFQIKKRRHEPACELQNNQLYPFLADKSSIFLNIS